MTGQLFTYHQMPVWNQDSIPAAFLARHNTQPGTWGRLRVLKGSLKFYELDEHDTVLAEHLLTPESGVHTIPPQAWHKIEPQEGGVEIRLEFQCEAADYFNKKYGMTATHSAVKAAAGIIPPCKAIDLGCGQGRNALFLGLLGFDTTASDYNPGALANIDHLAEEEHITVSTLPYDMNLANLPEQYDLMVATVVFMFLDPARVPAIIADMQAKTEAGGYNLIVSAMDTADFPCRMPFSFTFKEGELRDYYQGWTLHEYREETGAMHATDENGNPIQLKFVTMLAQKPA